MARDLEELPDFEQRFVRIEGKAMVGCDPELLPELECRLPFDESVIHAFRKNKLRAIELDPFEISVYPITNEEYWRFVEDTSHAAPQGWHSTPLPWTERPFLNTNAYHPVTYIKYSDARAYCRWLSKNDSQYIYRLPTREQWEAAARGAENRVYPWGSNFDSAKCNSGESGAGGTCDVRSFDVGKSPFGCQQMTGNVFEWLHDKAGNARFMRGGGFDAACEVFGMTFYEIETNDIGNPPSMGFRIVRT